METMNSARIYPKKRVLFVGEAVTLAHVGRPLTLAAALDRDRYETFYAVDPRCAHLAENRVDHLVSGINSIPSRQFLTALASGSAVYNRKTLSRYVEEDLAVIDAVQPDLIVGDFRISLSVSARVRNVSYMAIGNAHWSPAAQLDFPFPELKMTRWTGQKLGELLFQTFRPLAFKMQAAPLNAVRKAYGLNTLPDIRSCYTDSDLLLLADAPKLSSINEVPSNHEFLGPLWWEPPCQKPLWWDSLRDDRPTIYLGLGTSGEIDAMPAILSALSEMNVNVMLATAGRIIPNDLPENVYAAAYLPGFEAAKRANVMISNGGSGSVAQGLVAGTPIIGVCSNLDQFLVMQQIEKAKLGQSFRAGSIETSEIQDAVKALLSADAVDRSLAMKNSLNPFDAERRFREIIETHLGTQRSHVDNHAPAVASCSSLGLTDSLGGAR